MVVTWAGMDVAGEAEKSGVAVVVVWSEESVAVAVVVGEGVGVVMSASGVEAMAAAAVVVAGMVLLVYDDAVESDVEDAAVMSCGVS